MMKFRQLITLTFTILIFNWGYGNLVKKNHKYSCLAETKLIDTTINKESFVVYKLQTGDVKVSWGKLSSSCKFELNDLLDTITNASKSIIIYSKNSINEKLKSNIYVLDDDNVYFTLTLQDSRIAVWGINKEKDKLIFYKNIYEQVEPMVFSSPFVIINSANNDVIAGGELVYEEYPNNKFSRFSNVFILTTCGTTHFSILSYFRFFTDISVFDDPLKFYNKLFNTATMSNPLYKRKYWTGQ